MFQKDTFCSFCGRPFPNPLPYPKSCSHCRNTLYRNPLPVSVVLLPVDDSLLVIRRGIEPGKGGLALPGGYVNYGESWQEAGARELFEETGISITPQSLRIFQVMTALDGFLLVFGLAPAMKSAELPPFVETAETTECLLLSAPTQLAFPLHTEAIHLFFQGFMDGHRGHRVH